MPARRIALLVVHITKDLNWCGTVRPSKCRDHGTPPTLPDIAPGVTTCAAVDVVEVLENPAGTRNDQKSHNPKSPLATPIERRINLNVR
jgi:hypothetical protein